MFAVKGWSVDASSLKPQTQVFQSNANGEGGKKRKRDHREAQTKKEKKRLKREQDAINDPNKVALGERKPKGGDESGDAVEGGGAEDATPQDDAEVDEATAKKNKKKEKNERQQKQKSEQQSINDKAQHAKSKDAPKSDSKTASAVPAVPSLPTGAKLTPMQAAMRQKLVSARFRHLNQTLYTEPSAKALQLFAQNPEMFDDYHSGFRQQVQVWPQNPVDTFISTIRTRGKVRVFSHKKTFKDQKRKSGGATESEAAPSGDIAALPRTQGTCIIADIGCGDARLAQTLKESGDGQKLQLKVLSYDLHSPSKLVTKADASSLPAADGSVDIAIFCLALMGTNWISFIEEAYRILHWKGELWVAEIKSRFGRVGRANKPVEHSVGGKRKQAVLMKQHEKKKKEQEEVNEEQALAVEVDGVETKNEETDVGAFVDVLRRRGFVLKTGEASIDLSNKMFVKMDFVKMAQPTKGKNFKEDAAGAKPAERFRKTKAKFLDEDMDDVATEDEAKTLKPCLYKIR
ncbi:25S rRNA (adenine-N(1))-methyltransferase [Fulvia fulva]|uniref:Ribosomal RNA-processing protein 8 n=1 Tax=Passalora fulva TaxID=5499 RepID=A0A9Q8LDG2_PASFU|nr:25S rRNA (adenine-N(1))-methyltransferase [Fulvia fulva]KAK4628874.1 25S rRNA (adenine-N(1))-methyltransferase [Fulvia fulva]KAK4630618.1 25S rRNA (adenine-N(1))-methyltransferase [Fulvia fulva]UJO15393.1 25S rRNA (adenine-N(1))-methyltransferase [Fulvia fulva]WPV12366.1 25S rRNA (adenine-N(1))-methyltransferase [Fulvia fulva]WPV27164.1 25S rRNA (adenine-N(1))-methyltransferase [Fulvia fulva]